MPMSLHNALVPGWLQLLAAGQGWLDKAEASGIAEAELIEARLIGDMLPFAYQVKSMSVHSRGAIEGVRAGSFSPDRSDPPETLKALKEQLGATAAFLTALAPAELDAIAGRPMQFVVREHTRDFTVESFLLTFSQPNFFFHAVTTYDLLRMKGVEIGKRDYLGPAWLQPPPPR